MKRHAQLDRLRAVAASRGGECLIIDYQGMHAHGQWRCSAGHVWTCTPNSIVHARSWCPHCANVARRSIDDCHVAARARGGECLSKRLGSIQSVVEWQCASGHRWKSRAANVLNSKAWCPVCAGRRHTLAEFQALALSRGGSCMSSKYRGMQVKLRWQCSAGHQWNATPATILHREAWCPHCASGLGERLTRAALESLFGEAFPRTRPEWLRTPNSARLELDGFCARLGIAFEHQGDQHYRAVAFHGETMDFGRRQEYDEFKRTACAARGIELIEVPQVGTHTAARDLVAFLLGQLADRRIVPPNGAASVDLSKAYSATNDSEIWSDVLRVIESRGGETSEAQYLGSRHPIALRCSEGHSWRATSESIRRGKWCPYCSAAAKASKSRNSIEKLASVARARGGQLVSSEYKNARMPLLWMCRLGHEWSASYNTIRSGSWCPRCARIRRTVYGKEGGPS